VDAFTTRLRGVTAAPHKVHSELAFAIHPLAVRIAPHFAFLLWACSAVRGAMAATPDRLSGPLLFSYLLITQGCRRAMDVRSHVCQELRSERSLFHYTGTKMRRLMGLLAGKSMYADRTVITSCRKT